MKLQDAYLSEASTYVGNWVKIGYNMDASNNFTYTEPVASGWDNNTVALATFSGKVGWQASNNANLNDCSKGGTWGPSPQVKMSVLSI